MTTQSAVKTSWPPCDKCHRKVSTKTGYLGIDYREVEKVLYPLHPSAMTSPLLLLWRWGHKQCFLRQDRWLHAYWFTTIDSALIGITYLKGTKWFADTNWRETWKRFYDVEIDYDKLPTW